MQFLELKQFSYMFERIASLQLSDKWYKRFVSLCKILHANIQRTGYQIEFKDAIDVDGIPYITTHLPITDLQEKWIQVFISKTQRDIHIGAWTTTNIDHILEICGYQKYNNKDVWYKLVAYSVLTIELNKNCLLCTQWFIGSCNSDEPKIWSSKELNYQNKYSVYDIASLEARTGRELFAFYNLRPSHMDGLIPKKKYWNDIL